MAKASTHAGKRPGQDVLIYGPSGSAKTTMMARSPDVFIYQIEPQGLRPVIEANPDADVELIPNLTRFAEVHTAVKSGRLVGEGASARWVFTLDGIERRVGSIGLDSFTYFQELLLFAITKGEPHAAQQQDWGKLASKCRTVLDDLRVIPVSKVILALAQDTEDDLKIRRVKPAIKGALADSIGQFFTVVGYAHPTEVNGERRYVIDYRLGDRYVTKAPPRWPDRTETNLRPGDMTLGSIMLAVYGPHVPHNPCDRADYVLPALARSRHASADPAQVAPAAPATPSLLEGLVAPSDPLESPPVIEDSETPAAPAASTTRRRVNRPAV